MKAIALALVVTSLPAIGMAAEAQQAPPHCLPSGGYAQGPFVPTPAAARSIYLAIRRIVEPHSPLSKDERLVIGDEGDHWDAYTVVSVPDKDGRPQQLQGGGFGME